MISNDGKEIKHIVLGMVAFVTLPTALVCGTIIYSLNVIKETELAQEEGINQITIEDVGLDMGVPENGYIVRDVQMMLSELNGNEMSGKQKYQGEYIEIVGRIKNIDIDGNYIKVEPLEYMKCIMEESEEGHYIYDNIRCVVRDSIQRDIIAGMTVGEQVSIRGKVTSVKEKIGYSVAIAEIW